jgi:hypothetical protein
MRVRWSPRRLAAGPATGPMWLRNAHQPPSVKVLVQQVLDRVLRTIEPRKVADGEVVQC